MFSELQIDPASVMFKHDNKDLDLLQYLEAIRQEIIFSGPVPQKAFFLQTTIMKEMSVKLLTVKSKT